VRLARLFALLLLAALMALGWAAWVLTRPYAGFQNEVFVDFEKGTSTAKIAAALEEAGVIRARWQFMLARAARANRVLQAGEYRFAKPASPLEVFDRIARGDIFYHVLVVPEGRNMFDIAEAAEDLGLFPAARFLEAARNPAMIRDLAPRAPSLEGYLFPDTYRLTRRTTPERLCRIMTGRFREVWRGLKTDADVHRTITLASLVEKEGRLPEERPQIAAVFLKRLEIGMKLDCDPTTIYAALLRGDYRGAIYKSDLASDHPYNTYRNPGLPPGPIANPGVASIKAVLHPAESGALFFVARGDGSGGHTFSDNMAAHEAAIGRYRRALRNHK
jgi:UPF0755 protein